MRNDWHANTISFRWILNHENSQLICDKEKENPFPYQIGKNDFQCLDI